jgi:IS4 transposase
MLYYKQRGQIEILFRGLKSSGFNIEDTAVTDLKRLEKVRRCREKFECHFRH